MFKLKNCVKFLLINNKLSLHKYTNNIIINNNAFRTIMITANQYDNNKNNCDSSVVIDETKNVVRSQYGEIVIPEISLPEYVFERASEWGDKSAITCGVSGRTFDFYTIKTMVNRFAKALIADRGCSLNRNHKIGIILPNMPEYVVCAHGSLKAGLQVTVANPLYTQDEIGNQFKNCGVNMVITIPQLLPLVDGLKDRLSDFKGIICIGGDDNKKEKIFGFKSLLTTDHRATLPEININDIALIPYSSGTTGIPKGVLLTHRNLLSNLIQGDHPAFNKYGRPNSCCRHETALSVPPFFHIYGFNGVLNYTLRQGTHLVTIPKFTPDDYINCLSKYKPKYLFVVPSILTFLTSYPKVTKDHLSSVEDIMVGAAPATIQMQEKFNAKFGHDIKIKQGYGMTESSPVSLLTPYILNPNKSISCGQLYPGTEARIVSLEDGTNQDVHKSGELYIRGPQVMKEYLNNKKATDETIDKDGWLHTGDVACYDEDGYFYIVDRTKELIKVKGNQVSPTELENLIYEIDGIADVAVIGIPDEQSGEICCAFVVLKQNHQVTADEIISYVKERVIKYKQITGGVYFIKAIPRNASGKTMRNELKLLVK